MLSDFRLAFRSLARSPGYTAVVIATLALGIGTAAALHSYLEGTLLRRYNFPDMDRLVRLESIYQGNNYPLPDLAAPLSSLQREGEVLFLPLRAA